MSPGGIDGPMESIAAAACMTDLSASREMAWIDGSIQG